MGKIGYKLCKFSMTSAISCIHKKLLYIYIYMYVCMYICMYILTIDAVKHGVGTHRDGQLHLPKDYHEGWARKRLY